VPDVRTMGQTCVTFSGPSFWGPHTHSGYSDIRFEGGARSGATGITRLADASASMSQADGSRADSLTWRWDVDKADVPRSRFFTNWLIFYQLCHFGGIWSAGADALISDKVPRVIRSRCKERCC
jgi:hypothetical protein